MSFDFINPWMLAGLAGIALPVIAHLLSRKKYDVVNWGAMQFLELGRQAKRRIRLEELLLLLLRMGLIMLLAFAMSRPWLSGSLVSGFAAPPAGDYVLIVDGSYSGDWRGTAKTPHQHAVKWAQQFVDQLSAADTVALLDARDEVRVAVPTLIRDRTTLHRVLDELPQPTGISRLPEAIIKAMQILNTGTNLSRHVVVVTDGQAVPWRAADEHFWLQFRELRDQASVAPDVWVVNTQKQQSRRVNDSLDRLQLSRELAVVDFPVRIKTRLRNTGAGSASTRRVYLEVDGQRLADQMQSVRVEANGQATVEFEHRFPAVGSRLVAVSVDADNLPTDDRAEAVVSVTDALPVLLVDGHTQPDSTRSEAFFAKAALTAAGNPTPWVAATTIPTSQLTSERLQRAQVAVLANVRELDNEQLAALIEFVESGGGLAIALGNQASRDWYNSELLGTGLLPAKLTSLETASADDDAPPVTINAESLQLPWLKQFRAGASDGLLDARFSHWYRVDPAPVVPEQSTPVAGDGSDADPRQGTVSIAARFSNGDPWIVSRQLGRGRVALLTSTLDADWTTLPAKPDYVAFLHELIFDLTSGRTLRNVDAGTPLLFPIPTGDQAEQWQFTGPERKALPTLAAGDELRPLVRCDETLLPGIYRLQRRGDAQAAAAELFAVNFDRSESDLTSLSDEQWEQLTSDDRLKRIADPGELFSALQSDAARVETWHVLMLLFLAMLVGEVVMTRRLVQGGHVFTDDNSPG